MKNKTYTYKLNYIIYEFKISTLIFKYIFFLDEVFLTMNGFDQRAKKNVFQKTLIYNGNINIFTIGDMFFC